MNYPANYFGDRFCNIYFSRRLTAQMDGRAQVFTLGWRIIPLNIKAWLDDDFTTANLLIDCETDQIIFDALTLREHVIYQAEIARVRAEALRSYRNPPPTVTTLK